jgi:hypothetical protein
VISAVISTDESACRFHRQPALHRLDTEPSRTIRPAADIGGADPEPLDHDIAGPDRPMRDERHLADRGDTSRCERAPVLLGGVRIDRDQ